MKFGGRDGRELLITARTSIYAVEMKVRGSESIRDAKSIRMPKE